MKQEKLRKLLVEMDSRLLRFEKGFLAFEGQNAESEVVRSLSILRAEVRRHLSKIDALRLVDVEDLERRVERVREAAAQQIKSFGQNTSVVDLLRTLWNDTGLANISAGLRIGLIQVDPDDVIETLPGQKPAAFKFGFRDDKLTVVDQPLRPNDHERDLALAALESAVEHGEIVNLDLSTTNASPRLKEAFLRLQATLGSYKNIVQVGTKAQICNRLVQAEGEELSPSLFGLLVGHVEVVYSALAQFEEWRLYCENAASVNIDPGSVATLAESTRALAKRLRNTDATDPKVADALETVATWVSDQEKPDRRDVLSLARTLENIWSLIVKSVLSVGRETVSDSKKLVASAILGALLLGAAQSVPVISKVPGGEWIETVYNYLKSTGTKLSAE